MHKMNIKIELDDEWNCNRDDILTGNSDSSPVKQELLGVVEKHEEKEIPDTKNLSLSENQLICNEIKIEKTDVTEKILIFQPIIVVINVEKTVFYETNFVCSVCMHIYESFSLLQVHKNVNKRCRLEIEKQKLINTSKFKLKKLFKCGICEFKSKHKCYMKTHRMTHTGERPFQCDLCAYKCARSSTLKTHIQSHTKEKPFKCETCNYKSARRTNLKVHQISHASETPHECDQCNYKTGRARSLKLHKLTHLTQRPFQCEKCSYKSAYVSGLKSHLLSHSLDRPFACDQCDYKSTRNSQLTRHKMKHTGQMPYKCDLCNKGFDQMFNFKRHTKIHHAIKPQILNFEVVDAEFSGAK